MERGFIFDLEATIYLDDNKIRSETKKNGHYNSLSRRRYCNGLFDKGDNGHDNYPRFIETKARELAALGMSIEDGTSYPNSK